MVETPNPKRRRVDNLLDFIEKPSEDFYCPVTLEILTEPHQTLCCGNHLSQEAADRLKQARKPCPICNRSLNTVPDKFFKRQVNQLKVRCSKKALGCNWVGELGNLEKHLSEGSVDGECQYTAVACPLSCGDHIQRQQLEEHKSDDCPQRPFTCKHCGHKATYKSVMEDHWPRCEKYPLPCPNNCGENAIERLHLKQHLDKTCPLPVIKCKFSYAGCEIKCQRQEMQEHLDGNVQSHLTMVSEKQQEQIQLLTQQVSALASALNQVGAGSLTQPPPPVFIPPPDIVMTDFEKHKKDGDSWFSPPFYSHIGGYKFCVSVYADGWDGKGTHVGVGVHMMQGEYDDNLKWPFKGKVRVQLLNQRMSNVHTVERTTTYDNETNAIRVVGRQRGKGWGHSQFIPHTDLAYNPDKDCQYLMNDCLKFQVTEIKLET